MYPDAKSLHADAATIVQVLHVESIIQGISVNQSVVCGKEETIKWEVFELNVADPASGAFLTPGSRIREQGWIKGQDPDPG